jgi:3-oxoadipate enol-lactonase
MFFLETNGITHHYAMDKNKDKPVLVFCNSLGSDLRIWDGLVSHVAGDFNIIRYDSRGHGLTDAPVPPYCLDDLVQDLVGLLDRLEIKDAAVCGLSVGGLVAQRFAISHPQRLRALVLCDTGMRIGSLASWEERIATVKQSGLAPLIDFSMERWFTQRFRDRHPVELRGYANMLRRMPVEGYLGTCYALRDADLTAQSPGIGKPVLVLCGDQDAATPPELGQELARAIPGARFSFIRDAGHLSCIEQPEAMARHMIEFFREVNLV